MGGRREERCCQRKEALLKADKEGVTNTKERTEILTNTPHTTLSHFPSLTIKPESSFIVLEADQRWQYPLRIPSHENHLKNFQKFNILQCDLCMFFCVFVSASVCCIIFLQRCPQQKRVNSSPLGLKLQTTSCLLNTEKKK